MDIILLERVENLGQMGDLVKVKPGYARNFLLPTGKALRATKANMERFESERVQREADNLTRKSEAEGIAKKMENLSVSLIRAASEMGQLYGSVTSRDIAEGVTAQGYTVSKNQVDLNTAIKTLGLMPVNVILHPEVSVEVTVNIARSKDEAEEQIKLGRAIVNDVAERERLEAAEAAKAAEKRMAEFDTEDEQNTTGRDDSASNDAGANADADSTDDVADENADA
jgi:large subunit ribosomal protein L9